MKKAFVVIMALAMMLSSALAHATAMGIQVVGDADQAAAAVSLDDIQIGDSYKIDGYAVVMPSDFQIVDCFAQFGETGDYGRNRPSSWISDSYHNENNIDIVYSFAESGFTKVDWRYTDAAWMDSGNAAEFVWLVMDIVNLQKKDVDYTEEVAIKAVYQDDYEFNGWIRQVDYDTFGYYPPYSDGGISRFNQEAGTYPMLIVLNPAMNEAIKMTFVGTYVFGCTLPNYVIDDKDSPLRLEIQLGDNDITYNIRK